MCRYYRSCQFDPGEVTTGTRASGDRDDGEHAHGTRMVRGRATGASYAPHYGVQGAAPLLLGRRNDEKDGDRWWSTKSYGDGEKEGGWRGP